MKYDPNIFHLLIHIYFDVCQQEVQECRAKISNIFDLFINNHEFLQIYAGFN